MLCGGRSLVDVTCLMIDGVIIDLQNWILSAEHLHVTLVIETSRNT